ncbi:MAG: hypothetical protein L0Y58_24650 [Verrucomicrobia subdivision 3 bacterium]|nr:hypothetical protein [Limisphaerales bacterium]
MREKWTKWLPILLMAAFALSRWPGLLPWNFSAFYALAFCGGVFLPRKLAWWLPLTTLFVTDLLLNIYHTAKGYDAWQIHLLFNYAAAVVLIWLGTRFSPRAAWWKLVSGGLLGAILFYLITNTASWFFNPFNNPEYTKTLEGWIRALTKGTAGYPPTWEFFRNTLLSGGLFTGLFAGAMKLAEAMEPEEEKEEEPEATAEPEKTEA